MTGSQYVDYLERIKNEGKLPISFDTAMVKAILEGRKTQTRRVEKPSLSESVNRVIMEHGTRGSVRAMFMANTYSLSCYRHPKYKLGDILYVQESWAEIPEKCGIYSYEADVPQEIVGMMDIMGEPWRRPEDMPLAAARIFLQVTGIRVERLQDISNADAKAEGIRSYFLHKEHGGEWHESNGSFVGVDRTHSTRIAAFAELWDSLYAKLGYDWGTNPWVWVYDFERINI